MGDKPNKPGSTGKPCPEPARPLTYLTLRGTTGFMMHFLGKLDIQGRENFPAEGPVILASNHRAHVDPPYLGQVTTRQLFFMAKEELFTTNRAFGNYLLSLGTFPVRRGEADRQAIRQAINLLKEGRVVAIFPEGTRSFDDTLLPPEKGFALIAKQTGAPIVPIALEGTHRILPKGTSMLHRGDVCITIGKPVTAQEILESHSGDSRKDALDIIGVDVMRRIADLRRQVK